MSNEYLWKYLGVSPPQPRDWFNLTDADRDEWLERTSQAYRARHDLTREYSWAIPTDEALACIARYTPIVEIGAGTGYWAHLLQQRGVEIHAYDAYPPDGTEIPEVISFGDFRTEYPDKSWYHRGHTPYTEIRKGTQHVLKDYDPSWSLFLCWPPMDYMAKQALAFHRGKYVIYVGEGEWGCNANHAFFHKLNRLYNVIESITIPQWDGLHDVLDVYERR